jgi:hypothetical protein
VLLLDAQDFYGGAWASVSGRAFSRLLFGGDEAAAAPLPPSPLSSSSSFSLRPLPCHALPPLRATGVTTWRGPAAGNDEQAGEATAPTSTLPPLLSRCRAVDLLPRALYQGEPLVDGLVAARAHPYVEFKLVEGSYVLDAADGGREGTAAAAAAAAAGEQRPCPRLLRIPASKAHIFADRGLVPREKRALMRFLAAGLEAAAAVAAAAEAGETGEGGSNSGSGTASVAAATAAAQQGAFPAAAARSKEASSLVAALARRDVPLARVLRREGLPSRVRDFVLYGIAMACVPEEGEQDEEDEASTIGRRLSAADGRDALALYASSLGRFDAPPPPETSRQSQHQASGSSSSSSSSLLSAVVAPPPPPPASAFMAAAHGSGALVEAFVRHAAVRGALTVLRRAVDGLLLRSEAVAGVRLRAGGQELRAGVVVGARAALLESTNGSNGRRRLARCVAVLDGPLRPDGDVGASAAAVDTFALVVAPPSTSSSSVVARGLLLGPAAQAGPPPQPGAPPSSFLLYLVADVSHLPPPELSAEALLAPVLTRLARRGDGEEDRRPRVLEAVFYSQHGGGDEEGGEGAAAVSPPPPPPSGLVVCPGPDEVAPGVAGYVKAWAAAEALYRRHFPGLPWFGEQQRPGGGAGGGFVGEDAEGDDAEDGEGAGLGGGAEQSSDPPTEGLDAIDELSSALAALGEDLEGGKRG